MNIILHPDELFLKGANQRYFYNCLLKNITSLFPNVELKRVESGVWCRFLDKIEDKDKIIDQLSKIPGIANLSEAHQSSNELEKMKKGIDELLKATTLNFSSFRVTVKRSNKRYPIDSIELSKQLGEYVMDKYNLKVELKNHDLNIHVNILKDDAIIYLNPITGAGGLPTGSSGKVLCLLSGGIDSPVAAYQMMVRGAEVGFIHFHNQTSTSDEVENKIMDIAKQLSKYQPKVKLFMIPFADIQREIIMKVPADYRMIINRRIFMRIAQRVARRNKYKALVTGDSLGQVASQTIENITAVYQATDLLKFSPLIGMNKRHITDIANNINTLKISQRPYEDCCSMLVAKHPQTRAKLEDVLEIEKGLDLSTVDTVEIKSYNIGMIN